MSTANSTPCRAIAYEKLQLRVDSVEPLRPRFQRGHLPFQERLFESIRSFASPERAMSSTLMGNPLSGATRQLSPSRGATRQLSPSRGRAKNKPRSLSSLPRPREGERCPSGAERGLLSAKLTTLPLKGKAKVMPQEFTQSAQDHVWPRPPGFDTIQSEAVRNTA